MLGLTLLQIVLMLGTVLLATVLWLPLLMKACRGSTSEAESRRQWMLAMSILLWFLTVSVVARLTGWLLKSWLGGSGV